MNKHDSVKDYIETVCEQIRWKKARPAVADELETHILDQRDTFLHSGQDEGTATKNALAEMDDAVSVGTMLDHSYRPRMDWKILVGMLAVVMGCTLISVLLWRSESVQAMAEFFWMSVAYSVVFALPFCFIDFAYYAKIPKILFFSLVTCLILSAAKVRFFQHLDMIVVALLPFASLLMLFGMRGGGYGKFVRCGLLFVAMPCIGYFIYLYFCYERYWWVWAGVENFVVLFLSSVAMLTICVWNGFFQVSKKKALLTLYIPVIVFLVLFLVYSNLVLEYDSTQYDTGHTPMYLMRDMLQNSVLLGKGHDVTVSAENNITWFIYQAGWLPFCAVLAALAGFYTAIFKQCTRQRSVLGRTLSLTGWAALVIPTALGLLNAVGLVPYAYHLFPFMNVDDSIYACMVLGLLCNIFRNGDIVRDYKIKAIA